MSRQIIRALFDEDFIDGGVAAAGTFGEHRAEGTRGVELVVEQAGEVRDETVQESVTVLDEYDLGGFGWLRVLGILEKVSKGLLCSLCFCQAFAIFALDRQAARILKFYNDYCFFLNNRLQKSHTAYPATTSPGNVYSKKIKIKYVIASPQKFYT